MLGFSPLAQFALAQTQIAGKSGALAVTEPADLPALAGTAALRGALAVLEPADLPAFAGVHLAPPSGVLAVLEPADLPTLAGGLTGTIIPRPTPPATVCASTPASRDFCPTAADLEPQYLAMLPRGRAWAEGGAGREPGGIIHGFFFALSLTFAVLHAAICEMALEFFCATRNLTADAWLAEYGLPDPCDPYPDICAKVAAQGGATCADYQAVAAALGWSIVCGNSAAVIQGCALTVGCIEAGMTPGPSYSYSSATLFIIISLSHSPAYTGGQVFGAVAGFLEAGMAPPCADYSALDCVLQRIVGAHLQIEYALAA